MHCSIPSPASRSRNSRNRHHRTSYSCSNRGWTLNSHRSRKFHELDSIEILVIFIQAISVYIWYVVHNVDHLSCCVSLSKVVGLAISSTPSSTVTHSFFICLKHLSHLCLHSFPLYLHFISLVSEDRTTPIFSSLWQQYFPLWFTSRNLYFSCVLAGLCSQLIILISVVVGRLTPCIKSCHVSQPYIYIQ